MKLLFIWIKSLWSLLGRASATQFKKWFNASRLFCVCRIDLTIDYQHYWSNRFKRDVAPRARRHPIQKVIPSESAFLCLSHTQAIVPPSSSETSHRPLGSTAFQKHFNPIGFLACTVVWPTDWTMRLSTLYSHSQATFDVVKVSSLQCILWSETGVIAGRGGRICPFTS